MCYKICQWYISCFSVLNVFYCTRMTAYITTLSYTNFLFTLVHIPKILRLIINFLFIWIPEIFVPNIPYNAHLLSFSWFSTFLVVSSLWIFIFSVLLSLEKKNLCCCCYLQLVLFWLHTWHCSVITSDFLFKNHFW